MTTLPKIAFVEETGSTNADLIERLVSGERIEEGQWLCALRQSGGKGRSGRKWISPAGNLYASTIVNLRSGDPAPHTLSLSVGMGVYRYVRQSIGESHRSHVTLKWPNDVLVNGAKIAGILLERVLDAIVIGIGVNIDFAPHLKGRQTTCLRDLDFQYEADVRDALRLNLAPLIAEELCSWRAISVAQLIERWSSVAHPVGTRLSVDIGEERPVAGSFAGLDPNGSLKLRLADNSIRTIHAGDVSLVAEGEH